MFERNLQDMGYYKDNLKNDERLEIVEAKMGKLVKD